MHGRLKYLALVFILAGSVMQGEIARAQQCQEPTDISQVFCYTYTGFMVTMPVRACFAQLNFITNTMTMQYLNCTPSPVPTDTSNVAYCGYIRGQRRLFVHRSFGAPTMAHCQVTCDCGTLRIDETDGLPVELIEFDVHE